MTVGKMKKERTRSQTAGLPLANKWGHGGQEPGATRRLQELPRPELKTGHKLLPAVLKTCFNEAWEAQMRGNDCREEGFSSTACYQRPSGQTPEWARRQREMKAECFTVDMREKQHTLRTGKPEQLHGLGAQGCPLLPGPWPRDD